MSTSVEAQGPRGVPPLAEPGLDRGLRDVFKRRYLLKLLVQKELKARYQATFFGLAWSYAKPAVRFLVYFLVLGIGLRLDREVPHFPLHIFTGMAITHMLQETLGAGSNAIVSNRTLVRKMNVPREMLPVTTLLVSTYHALPQILILLAVGIAWGWTVGVTTLTAGVLAFAIVFIWSLAAALLLSSLTVYFRDVGNVADILGMLVLWSAPMIYPWSRVAALDPIVSTIYQFNPVAIAVMLAQRCFWLPTIDESQVPDGQTMSTLLPDDLLLKGVAHLVVGLLALSFAAWVFRRLQTRFAEFL